MAILIRGGTVVNHDWSRRADVLVVDDKIAAVAPGLDAPAGAQVIDAGGCYVMPGGIDPHTTSNSASWARSRWTISSGAPRRRCPAARR
jgi:dihydroorotase-like cyclic amidohydrolase